MARKLEPTVEIPRIVIDETHSEALQMYRQPDRYTQLSTRILPVSHVIAEHEDLTAAAERVGDGKTARVIAAIVASEAGEDSPVIPSIAAAEVIIKNYLKKHNPSGWLYKQVGEGVQPYLLTSIRLIERDGGKATKQKQVHLRLEAVTPDRKNSSGVVTVALEPNEVSRRTPEKILMNEGLFLETKAFRDAYDKEVEHFQKIVGAYGEQFRYAGSPTQWSHPSVPGTRTGKVILDLHPASLREVPTEMESSVTGDVHDLPVLMEVPVFDLHRQDFVTVRANDLVEYQYDESLAEKLVLPESHRTLMDVLTHEIDQFTDDFIEDKVAGNIILCQGVPGVGKTMTAEVYSEIIKRPLYSLSTVTLGITPDSVARALQVVFARAKQWNAVLLLDEADVFVTQRNGNLTRDAIVAEFLRVLEKFDGLLFMTTNLANVVDDAVLSRCAAVIPYHVPNAEDARRIWELLAGTHNVKLADDLLDQLVSTFPNAAPRDMKMLLRLVLRVAARDGVKPESLSIELFSRYAVFRNMASGNHPVF